VRRCSNDYDMAYIEVGQGRPLVCVHGSINDFRCWSAMLGPLSRKHRVIALSLRHFFPEQWDGRGGKFTIAQHVADVIAFIEGLRAGPVDLIGHSRGGQIAFRVAQRRPELLLKLILAEPGGELDASFAEAATGDTTASRQRTIVAAAKIGAGDIEGGLKSFVDSINTEGTWVQIPATVKQELRDNARTLLGQLTQESQPYRRAEAEAITLPTLFILGELTQGALPIILRALAGAVPRSKTVVIPKAGHSMIRHDPVVTSAAVLEFLAE
jgi:pimeloyl-ACP methyl ester carboxylesterase